MDEKELQALYKAMSAQFDIGGYDTFKAKMQTPDDRKRFYTAISDNGFDLGDYNTYEQRLAGVKKKEVSAASLVGQSVGLAAGSGDGKATQSEEKPEVLDPKDPLKSALNPIREKLTELRQRPVAESTGQNGIAKQVASERVDKMLQKKETIEKSGFGNVEEAKGFLKSVIDPSKLVLKGPIDITKAPDLEDYTEESIAAAVKGNETAELIALPHVKRVKDAKEALENSADLGEAAVKLAIKKGGITSEQIDFLESNIPQSMKGMLLMQALNDPGLKELASRDQELTQKINTEIYNFPDRYPAAAIRILSEKISQKMEDEGRTSWFFNAPGYKKVDEMANKLFESGDLPVQYKNLYDDPAVRFYIMHNLKTTGLIEGTVQNIGTALEGYGKSAAELTGIRGLYKSKQDQLYQALDKDYQDYQFKPKGLLHNISHAGGTVTGQIIPTAAGGNILLAAKLVRNTKTANAIMAGLQSFGYNKEQALKDLPKANELTQLAYATANTGFEIATENLTDDTKITRDLMRGVRPKVKAIITKFGNKEISAEVAQNQMNNIGKSILSFVQKAGKFGKGTVSVAKREAHEEAFAQVLQSTNRQLFGGRQESLAKTAEDAFEVWKTTFMGSLFFGIGGGINAARSDPSTTDVVYDVAGKPDYYKEMVQGQAALDEEFAGTAEQAIKNIDHAAAVRKEVDQRTDLNEKQKKQLVITSLNKKVLEEKAASSPDKSLNGNIEKQIAEVEIEQKKILNPEMANTKLVQEFYDNELLGKGSMDMLTDGETKKFSESKVGDYLKFVAQQANNLDENWQPHEGKAPDISQIPAAIVEVANKRWEKEIGGAAEKITGHMKFGEEEVPEMIASNTWYRGVNKNNQDQGDQFYSADESVAGDYAIDKVGDQPKMNTLQTADMPKNPLFVGTKEDLADEMGYPEEDIYDLKGDFDKKAKEYAQSNGYDAIMYQSGSMDAPELHVFGKMEQPTPEQTPPTETEPSDEELKNAEPIVSILDAEKRFSDGDRIFAQHELDEGGRPFELTSVGEIRQYTPDAMIAIPRKETETVSGVETDNAKMDGVQTDYVENEDGEKISLPEKGFLISGVYLKEGKEKGKGSGQELYKKALDENGVLYSHWPISDDAMRVHDKLEEKGIATIEHITLSDGTELRKITKVQPAKTTVFDAEALPVGEAAKPDKPTPPPKEQSWKSASGQYRVEYKDGKRIVKFRNGRVMAPTITKDVVIKSGPRKGGVEKQTVTNPKHTAILLQHAKSYNYDFGERVSDRAAEQQFNNEQEASQWVVENSSNPAEIAGVWANEQRQPVQLSSKDAAIAQVIGKVSAKSFDRHGDRNRVTGAIAKTYFSKDGRSVDDVANQASNYGDGNEVTPDDVISFMETFPYGVDPDGTEKTEVHRNAESKFQELTGIHLNKTTAAIAEKQNYSPEQIAENEAKVDNEAERELDEDEVNTLLDQDVQAFDNLETFENEPDEFLEEDTAAPETTTPDTAADEGGGGVSEGEAGTQKPTGKQGTSAKKLKQAQKEYDAAVTALNEAENKLAKEQGTQKSMFESEGTQQGLFEAGKGEASEILAPFREKVKLAKEALDKADREAQVEGQNQPKLSFADKLHDLADKIRNANLSGDKGTAMADISAIPRHVIALAIDGLAVAVEAGTRIKVAIEDAVNYIMGHKDTPAGIDRDQVVTHVNGLVQTLTGVNPNPKPQTGNAAALSAQKFDNALADPKSEKKGFFSKIGDFFKNLSYFIDNPNRYITRLQRDVENYYDVKTGKISLGRIFEQNVRGKGILKVQEFVNQVLKGLNKKGLQDFHRYIFARRVQDRYEQEMINRVSGRDTPSRETGNITHQDAINELDALAKRLGPEKMADFERRADNMQRIMDEALLQLVAGGVLSKEAYNDIKEQNDFYAPFNVAQTLVRQSDGVDRPAVASTVVKRIKGISFKPGESAIGDIDVLQDALADGTITKEEFFESAQAVLDDLMNTGKISDAEYAEEMGSLANSGFTISNIFDKAANIIFDAVRISHRNELLNRVADLQKYDKEGLFVKPVDGFELRYDKDGNAFMVPKRIEDIKVEKGFGVVGFRTDGKPKFLAIDEKAAKTINGLDRVELPFWMKGINAVNSVFRTAVITLSPAFQYANFIIDFLRSAAMNKYGLLTGRNIGDAAINAVLFIPQYIEAIVTAGVANFAGKNTKLYEEFMKSKGYSSGMYDDPFQANKRQLKVAPQSVWSTVKKSVGYIFTIPEKIGRTLEQSHKIVSTQRGMDVETGIRVGLARMKNLISKADSPQSMADALDQVAYETQNFAGSPNFPATHSSMKMLSVIFQFLSARVKGEMTDYRRFATMLGSGAEGRKVTAAERAQFIAQFTATTALPIVLMALVNNTDDEDEKQFKTMSEPDRNNNINIPYGIFEYEHDDGTKETYRDYIKIPVRGLPATMNTIANDAVQFYKSKDKKLLKHAVAQTIANISPINLQGETGSEMMESLIANMTPMPKWYLEFATNRDTYRHRDLISDMFGQNGVLEQYLRGDKEPYEVANKRTPQWAIDVSKWLYDEYQIKITPITLDHMENTFLGNVSDITKPNFMSRRMLRSKSNFPVWEQK